MTVLFYDGNSIPEKVFLILKQPHVCDNPAICYHKRNGITNGMLEST